uniref:Ig-like domain-containing protein n=1 Tax=Macrostomum lignano TaxID=282301 RepID=A0A1I8HU27_9PLAT
MLCQRTLHITANALQSTPASSQHRHFAPIAFSCPAPPCSNWGPAVPICSPIPTCRPFCCWPCWRCSSRSGAKRSQSNMETITWKLCPPAVSKVREGSEALIRCAAKTDSEVPNTNVYRWEWQKTKGVFSPIRLSPSAKYWYDSETSAKVGDLKIRSVDRDDTGQLLSCLRGARTASKLILCHRKSTLSVYWVNPIVSVRQLQPVRPPRQGEPVRLLCSVEASEEPAAVHWFLNGKLLQPVDQSLYAIVGRELAIRNLSYATLGLYHCYAEMQPGDKLFSREPRPVLPEDMVSFFGPPVIYAKVSSADEAAASDLVELKAEFPASFAVTWYRFTDIGLEPSKEPIAATDPNVQRVGNNLLLRAGSWRRFATRMNLLGGRVTFGYFFMCHGVDLAAKRMGYYVYQIIPAQAPPLSELDNFEPPLSRVRIVRAGSDFVQRVYLNVSGDTVVKDSAASGWAPLPTAVWRDPGGVAVAADGSLSNSRLSVSRSRPSAPGERAWAPSRPRLLSPNPAIRNATLTLPSHANPSIPC